MLAQYENMRVDPIIYQSKGPIQMTNPQFIADMQEATLQSKNALSEIDFKNIPGCIQCLQRAGMMCNKY